jgi:hypothetical protein
MEKSEQPRRINKERKVLSDFTIKQIRIVDEIFRFGPQFSTHLINGGNLARGYQALKELVELGILQCITPNRPDREKGKKRFHKLYMFADTAEAGKWINMLQSYYISKVYKPRVVTEAL